MKQLILFALLLLAANTQAQEVEPQKSLLWKIEHPNSEKTSYLYGTMHISGRLAYHLGEEFFNALESTDAVALESNPIYWLEEIFSSQYASDYLGKYGFRYQTYKGFYTEAFKIEAPDNNTISGALSSDHYLTNWLLYRENKSQRDFEEETFLDLFIYQAGLKNNKRVYSLEKFNQTRHFSKLGDMADPEKKEYEGWYEKLLEEKNAAELIRDAYRNKDVLLIDSLHRQLNTENFYKYMLVERNDLMAYRIDSLILQQNISLFIGIGAAHLAGEDGVIEMLRRKGYTVSPVSTTINDAASQAKTALDLKKRKLDYKFSFENNLFAVKTPEIMYETPTSRNGQRQFFAPELTNGSQYVVKIISTYSYLSKTNISQYPEKIDSLLFESIPGDILEKKRIEKNGFKGLDLVNKTSNGNHQRYQIFYTPMNLIIFKMGGKDVFVAENSDEFFNSIQLKPVASEWKTFNPIFGDFSIKTPGYYNVHGNEDITALYNHIELEAYDKNDANYYLLKRASLYDWSFIEQDGYELNRIADKFCDNLDIEDVEVEVQENTTYPTALAHARTPDSSYLALKIVIKGPFYYLLANISPEKKATNEFFTSFEFQDLKYRFPFERKVDSTLLFSVNSNYLYPTQYTDLYTKADRIRSENLDKKKEDNTHKEDEMDRTYYSENYERINVLYYKFHDYTNYDDIDSLWEDEIKLIAKKHKFILREKKPWKKDGIYYLDAIFSDTNSSRTLEARYIVKEGVMYNLLTNGDTLTPRSKFVSEFYDSFQPLDTVIGISLFEDKAIRFFDAIASADSTRKIHAYQSVSQFLDFKNEHAEQLMNVITTHPFGSKYIGTKADLIEELGFIKHPEIVPFLENLYQEYEDTASYQISILKALAYQKTKAASETLVELLEYDIPLSGSGYGISPIFYGYYDTLELTQHLYPELLNYTFVDDYKQPVYYLLRRALKTNDLKSKIYKKQYKQILREAKLELKKQISYEQTEQAKESSRYYYTSYKNKGNYMLTTYAQLLLPFYKKSDVQAFFMKMNNVQDLKVRTRMAILFAEEGITVPETVWEDLAADLLNREHLYESLEWAEMTSNFPAKYKTHEYMAASMLYNQSFNPEKDSMEFVSKQKLEVDGKEGFAMFFKSKKENADEWKLDYIGLMPLDENEVNTRSNFSQKGIEIPKHKTIEEVIEEEIENILIQGHPRAKKKVKGGGYFWGGW